MHPRTAWAIHSVAADCRVQITRPMPPLPPALEAEIDRLWAEGQAATDGKLFNGGIFSADVITPHLICGHWSEYRRAVAQMRRPGLHPLLGVRSLAVGGVVVSPDGVVFGQRPARAVYQAGEWQLPPAGSVDPTAARADGMVDVRASFLTELGEELGIEPGAVHDLRPLCIVEHAPSHVLDFGIAATTRLTADEIRDRHARLGNDEYDPLAIVPIPELPGFLAQAGELLNLQAPAFLRLAGVL
jgi:phage terminase small subunit